MEKDRAPLETTGARQKLSISPVMPHPHCQLVRGSSRTSVPCLIQVAEYRSLCSFTTVAVYMTPLLSRTTACFMQRASCLRRRFPLSHGAVRLPYCPGLCADNLGMFVCCSWSKLALLSSKSRHHMCLAHPFSVERTARSATCVEDASDHHQNRKA